MKSSYSSRERILCTMSHEEPDHVPLWNIWRKKDLPFDCHNEFQRVEAVLEMGLDDTVLLKPPGPREDELVPGSWIRDVRTRSHIEAKSGQRYPILSKEYITPEGTLCQSVKKTEDWPFGEDIPLLTDFNISNGEEFLVKTRDDFQALKYILKEPTGDQIREFRDRAKRLRDFARNKGAMLDGGWLYSMDMAIWLYGFEQLTLEVMDDQGLVQELLEVIFRWEKPRLELLLEEKVDLMVHSSWYDLPHYWSPGLFRKLMKPVLKKEIDLCHSAGVPFCYILTAGSSMVLDDLLEVGVDAIRGIDPVQGYNDDLASAKEKVGDRITLWGGINSAVTLGKGTPDEIREAVDVAIEILAPGGGFVMYPVDQIFTDTPMENFEIMVERWKAVSDYY